MSLFDARQVRRGFSRAAGGYASAASLQREIEARLLEMLDYRDEPALGLAPPGCVVDLGAGHGHAALAMQRRWPQARVLAIDAALPMLRAMPRPRLGWLTGKRVPARICADARALPLADGCVDVLFSNLCLQWVEDLPCVLATFRRVLRPGGLLLFSLFGPETLCELREAFAQADDAPHVSPFAAIAQIGDALTFAGFRDPVLDRDVIVEHHPGMDALMRSLRALGATNALSARRWALTGRGRFAQAASAYEQWREPAGLPASWEVITAMALAPQHGQPIRQGGIETASMPVSAIPIRRR